MKTMAAEAKMGETGGKFGQAREAAGRRPGRDTASQEALARAARVLRAIQMRGGEVVETGRGDLRAFAALDGFGGEVERFDAATVDALRSSGALKVRRFERGGVVLGVSGGSPARAAYISRG